MNRHEWTLNPEWLHEPSWEEVARGADRLSPEESTASIECLRDIYPKGWAKGCGLDHGVAWKQLTYCGRLSLLELGFAAHLVGIDDVFTGRLRNAREFPGAEAELRAFLLLRKSGAILQRSQSGEGSRVTECIAAWGSGRNAVVEVKALRDSDDVRRAEQIVTTIVFQLAEKAYELRGFSGHVHWNAQVLLGGPPKLAGVVSDVRSAIDAAKAATGGAGSRVALGNVGTLVLKPSESDSPLSVTYDSFGCSSQTADGKQSDSDRLARAG